MPRISNAAPTGSPSAEDLDRIIAPLLRIPFEYRCYRVTPAAARKQYGIGPELCQWLTEIGVPHLGQGPEALFDDVDLASVSLYLGLPSIRRFVLALWPRSLRQLARGATSYTITVEADCPTPNHAGPCGYLALAGDGGWNTVVSEARRACVTRLEVAMVERPYPVPPALRPLLTDFADIAFYPLPLALQADQEFLVKARIANCGLFSKALVDEALRRGYQARAAFGVVIAAPFSQPHWWAEIFVDGRWTKLDPLMARALQSFGICTPDDWPATMSPAGLYHRIGDAGPLASHEGMACDLSLRTTVRP